MSGSSDCSRKQKLRHIIHRQVNQIPSAAIGEVTKGDDVRLVLDGMEAQKHRIVCIIGPSSDSTTGGAEAPGAM